MRKITFFLNLLIVSVLTIACSQSSKLESTAKKQMEATFKEMAKDPESAKIENIQTVFSNDSLCIIHADFSAKNGFGHEVKNKGEYVFLSSNGKNYEAYQDINSEEAGVFVKEEKYTKDKKGTIYEPLNYDEGLRYLAAIFVNGNGREAGAKDYEDFTIPVPTGTGSWELKSYKDEFGENSASKYLVLLGKGIFSNSATTNSKMSAVLFYDKSGAFALKLVEYDSNIAKDNESYTCRIKDSKGLIYEMTLRNNEESGQLTSDFENNKTMKSILECGGVITVSLKERFAYSTPSTYLFKLNVSGFKKAIKYL